MPSTLESNQLLAAAVDAAESKKAEEIRILALDPAESSLTDYFLICNGTNERQNAAIADEIEYRLKKDFGVLPNSVEGRRQGEWILMDYVDFVVHIFMPEKREYYGLERLRKTAKTISAADLNEEIKAALAKTRAKSPARAVPQKAVAKKAVKAAGMKPTKAIAKPASKKAVKVVATSAGKTAVKVAAKKVAAKKAVKVATKSALAKKSAAKSATKKTAAKKQATK